MKTKLQVFISSTYKDLKEERQSAVQTILRCGHIPAGMELFIAGDKSQWEIIQKWIGESDVYVLILGTRYGSIEPQTGVSYTELEYDYAISLGLPFFAVVISDEGIEQKKKVEGVEIIEKDNSIKLEEFRKKVLNKISSFFTDTKDLKLSVYESLSTIASEHQNAGWIRYDDSPDVKSLTDELIRLHNEIDKLKDEASKIKKADINTTPDAKKEQDIEYSELEKILRSKKIDISSIKKLIGGKNEKLPDEIPLLNLLLAFKEDLLRGVTNQYGINDLDSFLYFRLCPQLQIYDLVVNEKVASVQYRRYSITKIGTKFLAYIEKKKYLKSEKK